MPLLVAALLRAHTLVSRDLWHDEGLQFGIANSGRFVDIVQACASRDLHPPLYSLLMGLFVGLPPWMMRLPSIAAGVFGVWFAYQLGERLGGKRSARNMAWFSAVAPAWVAYGHEARPYAVGVMLVLALYASIFRKKPNEVHVAFWGVACGLWQYGTALVACGALLTFARAGRMRRAFAWTLGSAPCSAAFLLISQWQRGRGVVGSLPGADGMAAPWGVVELAGWLLTGTPGVLSAVAGVGMLLAVAWCRSDVQAKAYEAALTPLAIGVGMAIVGWYPIGAIRQSLPWTVPILVLAMGPAGRLRGVSALVTLLCLVAVCMARAPGVPVEEQRMVLAQIEERLGPRWVHASAAPAYQIYGVNPPEFVLSWGDSLDVVPSSMWLVASGRACSTLDSASRAFEIVERVDAAGACALWLVPRSP